MSLNQRRLGTQGLTVSAEGLGCMGMSEFYGTTDEAEGIATIHRALELGVTLLDTADVYGPHTNEQLVGRAIADRRDQVVLATKFGIVRDPADPMSRGFDGSPDYVRRSIDASLRRLGVEHVDLYYQHRVDPAVPIEDVIGTLSELIAEGKIRHIGLSEAGRETIRRAHAVHPIAALQSEYSLWSRDADDGTLDLLRELGIGFVPYSPLNRGLLAGTLRTRDQLEETDWRLTNPRFLPGAIESNVAIVEEIAEIGGEVGATPAQVSLAWLLAQGDDWSPIPGTIRVDHLEEDLGALDVTLSAEQVQRLTDITPAVGGHHTEAQARLFDR